MSTVFPATVRCIFCLKYLDSEASPRQAACGDRLCGACLKTQKERASEVQCPTCSERIVFAECFRDKAVEQEVANLTVSCTIEGCTWKGTHFNWKKHSTECQYALVSCPNRSCGKRLMRKELSRHCNSECSFQPIVCHSCSQSVPMERLSAHLQTECAASVVECTNKCGHKCQRKMLQHHTEKQCLLRQVLCNHINCTFKGTVSELQEHECKDTSHHIHCLETAYKKLSVSMATSKMEALEEQAVQSNTRVTQLRSDMTRELQPIMKSVKTLEFTVRQLQLGFNELALVAQSLQATSYNGRFTWKIPEIHRRRNEAISGKTISLYSAPFYAGRHGYKMCLRLYLNGDGSGLGSHLSFFISIMRGEYDALLPWPLRQTVTMILLDQDKQKHVVQSFRPEPSSASFQRPCCEMNVVSGCPMFAPISVLTSTSFVKDDIMFLQCKVDCSGLEAYC